MLHKKLLESEVQSKLKGKIYNMGFVGDAYSDANEAREKRQKVDLETNGAGYSQSSMSSHIPSLSKTLPKKLSPLDPLSEMPSLTEEPLSLKLDALDDIADISIGSEFASELTQDERKLANFALSELFR
ncbi:hypothetical protein BG005_007896 [Podila minutissima]|nr:hypothetical protein BG005_007896 [Podila minutissima]